MYDWGRWDLNLATLAVYFLYDLVLGAFYAEWRLRRDRSRHQRSNLVRFTQLSATPLFRVMTYRRTAWEFTIFSVAYALVIGYYGMWRWAIINIVGTAIGVWLLYWLVKWRTSKNKSAD